MKTFRAICLFFLLAVPACAPEQRQQTTAERSSAQIELLGAKIRLYHRGRLMLEAAANTLQAEEINHLWRAKGINAKILEAESP